MVRDDERKVRRLLASGLLGGWIALAVPAALAKQPICGLVAMGSMTFLPQQTEPDNRMEELAAHPGVYAAAVIIVTWKQLEPSQGRLDTSEIDRALAAIARYNAANPGRHVVGKLRVFAGAHAPDWALALGGPPVQTQFRQVPITIGRFWTAPYRAAWADLQRRLAARYDGDPRIGEVAISSCSTHSAEPFHARVTPPSALAALKEAGYSDDAERACIMGALDDYAAWKTTPLDFTVSTFLATDSGHPRADREFPVHVLEAFRARYGGRAVIATHGLDEDLPASKRDLYEEEKRMGPPMEFQTVSPHVDFDGAIRTGLGLGATEIELWDSAEAGGQARFTAAELAQWSQGFSCQR